MTRHAFALLQALTRRSILCASVLVGLVVQPNVSGLVAQQPSMLVEMRSDETFLDCWPACRVTSAARTGMLSVGGMAYTIPRIGSVTGSASLGWDLFHPPADPQLTVRTPSAHFHGVYEGLIGNTVGNAALHARLDDVTSFKGLWGEGGVTISDVVVEVGAAGLLTAPPRPCYYCGWKTVSAGVNLQIGLSLGGFGVPFFSEGWRRTWSASSGGVVKIAERATRLSGAIFTPLTLYHGDVLSVPILFDAYLDFYSINWAGPLEAATGDLGHTLRINDIRLYDDTGRDVTGLFEARNSAGELVFGSSATISAVPEPGTLGLIGIAFAALCIVRVVKFPPTRLRAPW
jgi:hypothetical protein